MFIKKEKTETNETGLQQKVVKVKSEKEIS